MMNREKPSMEKKLWERGEFWTALLALMSASPAIMSPWAKVLSETQMNFANAITGSLVAISVVLVSRRSSENTKELNAKVDEHIESQGMVPPQIRKTGGK